MNHPVRYETLERLRVQRPVERVSFIAELCRDKHVLDIGCLDETAIKKQSTDDWLHRRIGKLATTVLGIDSSSNLPEGGLITGENSRILRGNGLAPDLCESEAELIDIIVAGEFIEHLENPLAFLHAMKQLFPGRQLLLSTPNGISFANALLAMISCEAQHHDHLLTSTYKTLNTLCRRSGCKAWEIIPYRFYATEMLLESTGIKRLLTWTVERAVRVVEYLFPLRSFGYVVRITL